MQIPKSLLLACAAALLLGAPSICSADDAATTNAPAMTTNATQSAESKPMTKAEKKKAEKAAKKQAEADAKAKKDADAAAKKDADKSKAAAATPPVVSTKHPPALQPIAPPPNPLSAEKQKQLADLLAKYKADQITPEEYHTARAKILAGQ